MEVTLKARKEPLRIEPEKTALVVVDMQNAFCTGGGLFDRRGMLDEAKVRPVIDNLKAVTDMARQAGIKVVYLRMGYRNDMADCGGPRSPNYWKEGSLAAAREQPEMNYRGLVEGSTDWQIIDELSPREGDIPVNKNRYSGFANTQLDSVLKTHNISYLIFGGLFTNVCVESTVRDAFFHEYFPILVSDLCAAVGPEYTQQATLWAVANVFGWVTDTAELLTCLNEVKNALSSPPAVPPGRRPL